MFSLLGDLGMLKLGSNLFVETDRSITRRCLDYPATSTKDNLRVIRSNNNNKQAIMFPLSMIGSGLYHLPREPTSVWYVTCLRVFGFKTCRLLHDLFLVLRAVVLKRMIQSALFCLLGFKPTPYKP